LRWGILNARGTRLVGRRLRRIIRDFVVVVRIILGGLEAVFPVNVVRVQSHRN
jgi:hypothetical protein